MYSDSCCALTQQLSFFIVMRRFGYIIIFSMLLAACKRDGDSNIPEIPDDPNGTRTTILSHGGTAVFLDDTGNGLRLAANGTLQGNNLFFTSSKKCDGLVYVASIPLSDWRAGNSAVLKKGEGLVVGSRMFDGATFTRLFVDDVDETTGDVTLKSQSPFYGNVNDFYLNHKQLILKNEEGDTTVAIIKPTTYNVELASGEWASINPYVAHVKLSYKENMTGSVRFDTLIFSNGILPEKRLPITQLHYSLSDAIINK